MPTKDGFLTESELDALAARQGGESHPDTGKPLTAEEREQQRQRIADDAHERVVNEPDRKVRAERRKTALSVLKDGIQSRMRHGVAVSDAEKQRITEGIVTAFGKATPSDVTEGIRRFVDVAAQAYRDGEPGKAWVLAEEAATAIANADFELGPQEVDNEAEMDPGKLADLIQGR